MRCPQCQCVFDEETPACILTCQEGHILCLNCLKKLWKDDTEVEFEKCWLLGKNCHPSKRHKLCPQCFSAFHIRDNNLDNVLRLPLNIDDMESLLLLRRITRQNILISAAKLKEMGARKIDELTELINAINGVAKKGRIAKIGSSSVGVVGGILMLTGAVLAIPSMGASTPLLIAGGVMSGSAASATLGTNLTEFYKNRKITQEAIDSWKEIQKEFEEFLHLNQEFSIQSAALVVSHQQIVKGTLLTIQIAGSVVGVINLASQLVSTTSSSVIQTLAQMVGRSVATIGLISSSFGIIVDTVLIVWNSMEIYKNKPSEFAPKLEEIIENIRNHIIKDAQNAEDRLIKFDDSFIEDMLKLHKEMTTNCQVAT